MHKEGKSQLAMEYREPPRELFQSILLGVQKKEIARRRFHIFSFSALFLVALTAFVLAWQELQKEFAQSGFLQFVSLIFSDSRSIIAYWQDFGLSLAESFPVLGLSAVFASIAMLLLSLRALMQGRGGILRKSISLKI